MKDGESSRREERQPSLTQLLFHQCTRTHTHSFSNGQSLADAGRQSLCRHYVREKGGGGEDGEEGSEYLKRWREGAHRLKL